MNTCQICGRAIKLVMARSGVELIAHHGYQRPYKEGWQTSSCFGARYRPYEVACDALPPAIEQVEHFIVMRERFLAQWRAEPPATVTQREFRHDKEHTYDKPDGFDPTKLGNRAWQPGTYESAWRYKEAQAVRDIERGKSQRADLRKRLAEWKAA